MAALVGIDSGRDVSIYVTGFERTRLPRTQQEDTLFTITHAVAVHTS